MAYACFWVQGECVRPNEFSCKGCAQFPYGEAEVKPPGVPADIGQQLIGMHIGLAELLAKKGIAKPEELDEAIARNIEGLVNQDMVLRNAACEVDHVLDAMPRLSEPGLLELYVAVDEEGLRDQASISEKVVESLRQMVPREIEIRVMVAEKKPGPGAAPESKKPKGASAAKKQPAKSKSAPKSSGKSSGSKKK